MMIRRKALAVVLIGIIGLVGCGGSVDETVTAATPAGAGQEAKDAAPPTSAAREDVGDAKGNVVGSFSSEDADKRRDVVREQLLEILGEKRDLPQDDVSRLMEALQVLNPLEVTDESGTLVGYMVVTFVPAAEYPAMKADAEAVVARYRAQLASS